MTADLPDQEGADISPDVAAQIDAVCDEFRFSLRRSGIPRLTPYVNRLSAGARQVVLARLVEIAAEFLQARGDANSGKTIRDAYPELDTELESLCCDLENTISFHPQPQSIDSSFLAPGTQLGTYRLVRLLGKGGMGAVYEAQQLTNGRRIALKVIKDKNPPADIRRRFLREGRLAAAINHPNSVYIYGTEDIDGQPVIAMELAAEGTLSHRVAQDGPLSVPDAVDAVLDIVAGLVAAYAQGILHRDIKPSNCFVATDGRIQIGDFGLSVSTIIDADTLLTKTGSFQLGTPQFASPEQLRGKELDVRSDIYSVGATLYYLLTGKPPFNADQLLALIAKVLEEQPVALPKSVPLQLKKALYRCLAKEPTRRFQTYDDLRNAILPFSSLPANAAPRGQRFAAGLIDYTVLDVAAFAIAGLATMDWRALRFDGQAWTAAYDAFTGGLALDESRSVFVFFVSGFLLVASYYTWSESRYGASLGKWVFGLQVNASHGGKPSLR